MVRMPPVLLLAALALAACSNTERAADDNSGDRGGGGPPGPPPAELVAIFETLPVFPHAVLEPSESLSAIAAGIGGLQAFYRIRTVPTETVVDFYVEALAPDGWASEGLSTGQPGAAGGSKALDSSLATFVRGDVRLGVWVSQATKAINDEHTTLQLFLAPLDFNLFPSPIGTPIESTPFPTQTPGESPTGPAYTGPTATPTAS